MGRARLEMAGSRLCGVRRRRAGDGGAGDGWQGPILRWLTRGGGLEVAGSRQCGAGDGAGQEMVWAGEAWGRRRRGGEKLRDLP